MRHSLKTLILALSIVGAPLALAPVQVAQAAEIKYVVNGDVITSVDIQRRAAFLKLQRAKGNLNQMAGDQMIEQSLRLAEMKRLGINITNKQVDDAYARFASGNKMKLSQLDQIMAQSGVTKNHFKQFIRSQMGWGQAVSMRAQGGRSGQRMTEREAVQQMFQKEGRKASAQEYLLQQVIFVVPPKERGAKLGARKREAEALRVRFNGCNGTKAMAKGLIDVTVRDLGRTLAPELPPDWAESIKSTKVGRATPVRETERGVEFIGICSAREVTDDRVSQLLVQSQGMDGKDGDALSKGYIDELKKNAKITTR